MGTQWQVPSIIFVIFAVGVLWVGTLTPHEPNEKITRIVKEIKDAGLSRSNDASRSSETLILQKVKSMHYGGDLKQPKWFKGTPHTWKAKPLLTRPPGEQPLPFVGSTVEPGLTQGMQTLSRLLSKHNCTCSVVNLHGCQCGCGGVQCYPLPLMTFEQYWQANWSFFQPDDVISSLQFMWMADVRCARIDTLCSFNISGLPNRTVFYLDPQQMERFWDNIRGIHIHFFLISHQRDFPICPEAVNDTRAQICEQLLAHPLLLRWYAINVFNQNRKLRGIPLGIHPKSVAEVFHARSRLQTLRPTIQTFLKFNVPKHKDCRWRWSPHCHRRAVVLHLKKNGFPVPSRQDIADRIKDRAAYYATLMDHRFIITPPGNGYDSFRAWETLFLGRAAVLETTSIDPLFEQLPVVSVDFWQNLTVALLEAKWRAFSTYKFAWEKLWMPYWWVKLYTDMHQAL
eukprot:GGOE01020548.1.p1 GENE.GGOE01020548.1~~GGOE01020548.1.p1  ORF type:complete len:455 (+),score=99.34 GGOE01020548.1:27-1391(+)